MLVPNTTSTNHDLQLQIMRRRHGGKDDALADADDATHRVATISGKWNRSRRGIVSNRQSFSAALLLIIVVAVVCVAVVAPNRWLYISRLFHNTNGDQPALRGSDEQQQHTKQQQSAQQQRVQNSRRVVAIGDIHGDRDALVRALQLARVVDSTRNGTSWTGGSDVVVQIGDLLNRAESRDLETLSYLADIERQAREAGGAVIVTVGDHDLHNAPKLWHDIHGKSEGEVPLPPWITAAYMADRTLFVHGSLSKTILDGNAKGSGSSATGQSTLKRMVQDAQDWMSQKVNNPNAKNKPAWIGRGDGPIWSRLYSDKASDEHPHCDDDLLPLLRELGVDRMVVGHTVRREGISSICNKKVWRIDVGLSRTESRAGKIGASEVLELSKAGGVVRVLSTDVKLTSWKDG